MAKESGFVHPSLGINIRADRRESSRGKAALDLAHEGNLPNHMNTTDILKAREVMPNGKDLDIIVVSL